MTMDPDIRDQAYQFFIEEAPELLEVIETGLLNLRQNSSTAQLHELMRAAHSIKGGAASVELHSLKTLAHRLETIFKALYSDQMEISATLESQLLRAYDCLREPLVTQIETGHHDGETALAAAEPILTALEADLGPALEKADSFIPSAADLGIDMVASMFEIDVQQGIDRLTTVLSQSAAEEQMGELLAQAEVFSGFAELFSLPGFGAICDTAVQAARAQPDNISAVLKQTIQDLTVARSAVLAGERDQGGQPSAVLLAMAAGTADHRPLTENLLEDVFGIDPDEIAEMPPASLTSQALDPAALDLLDSLTEVTTEVGDEIGSGASDGIGDGISNTVSNAVTDTAARQSGETVLDWTLNGWEDSEQFAIATSEDNVFDLELDETLMGTALEGTDGPVLSSTELLNDDALPPPPKSIAAAVEAIAEHYDALPVAKVLPAPMSTHQRQDAQGSLPGPLSGDPRSHSPHPGSPADETHPSPSPNNIAAPAVKPAKTGQSLTARIALKRLERMDNLVGELAINRNGLSLQNEQFQRTVRSLKQRFGQFRGLARQLQTLSDKILVSPEQSAQPNPAATALSAAFDSLEMDSYSAVNVLLEALLEEVLQVEEAIEDVQLFAGQSNRNLGQQQQLLTQLRDELMWSRMVPLSGVLNRFPRILRELSTAQNKSAQLKLVGTDVPVDRVMLEKLYDPLLHLLRNAFDHGLESASERVRQGKPETGTIEIRAYRRGNSIFLDIRDDGQGLSLDKIGQRAVVAGLITAEALAVARPQQIYDLIFEPGFSTATRVSEISGRGMGMDIVRSRLQALNGKVTLTTETGQGTTFTLRIPLTLTLSKLLVAEAGDSIVALAADSIEEILIPTDGQLKTSAGQRFLIWRDQVVPIHTLADGLTYHCPIAQCAGPMAATLAGRYQAKKPLLILQQGQSPLALEIDQVLTEQELVIKPFGGAIAPPSYINGCTVLGDGQLVPVIDGSSVVGYTSSPNLGSGSEAALKVSQTAAILIVDDSSAMRRTTMVGIDEGDC